MAKEIRICQILVTPYSGIAEMLKCGSYEENIYHFNVGIATDLLRWYKPLQLFLREVLATIAMHVRLCTL